MSKKRKQTIFIIIALLIAGIFIKCYYVKNTETWERQHDVIGFGADEGHAAYIEYILNEGHLPDFDPTTKWAFFQPPLHHIISAQVMKLSYSLGLDEHRAQENTQIPTCIYMILLTLMSGYIYIKSKGVIKLSHSNAPTKAYTAGFVTMLAIVGLHPMFILLSASINNDSLALCLSVLALIVGVEWYDNPTIVRTIILAIVIGLAMEAKLTGGLVAVPIGILMVMKFFSIDPDSKRGPHKSIKKRLNVFFADYSAKALIFALIVFPLGLAFWIYNKIKWNMPINFIPVVGERFDESVTLAKRLLDIKTDSVYTLMVSRGDAFDEYCIPLAMVKTSLFSEFSFESVSRWMKICTLVLFVSAIVLIVLALFATAVVTFSSKSMVSVKWKIALLGTYVTYMAAYLYFVITHRNFSAQDFRYAAICIMVEGIFLGLYVDTLKNAKAKYIISGIAIVFAIASFMTYGLLGFKGMTY